MSKSAESARLLRLRDAMGPVSRGRDHVGYGVEVTMADRIVAEVAKSARERFRVMLRERRGRVGCEVLVVERNAKGDLIETPRGLRVAPERLGEMITAMQDAERLATRLGLIDVRERS